MWGKEENGVQETLASAAPPLAWVYVTKAGTAFLQVNAMESDNTMSALPVVGVASVLSVFSKRDDVYAEIAPGIPLSLHSAIETPYGVNIEPCFGTLHLLKAHAER